MNHNEFSMITGRVFSKCMKTMNQKAGEYARDDDRLHNFKAAGALQRKTPVDALGDGDGDGDGGVAVGVVDAPPRRLVDGVDRGSHGLTLVDRDGEPDTGFR